MKMQSSSFEISDRFSLLCFLNEELFEEKKTPISLSRSLYCRRLLLNYNLRVLEAIEQLKNQPSFAIIDKGVDPEEKSCILVLERQVLWYGFIGSDIQIEDAASFLRLCDSA